MNKDKIRATRRKLRVRKKLNEIKKHKLLVFRSSKHIYASVLSESNDKTLCSFSSVKLKKDEGQKKVDVAKIVGSKIAELAIEKGIQEWQSVWKVTSEVGENGPHYIINTGFSSKEQLDAYNESWTTQDWVALAKEAHKGKISNARID